MTKKPPKTLWVNVYPNGVFFKYNTEKEALENCMQNCFGTFKYVLAEKGKK